MADAKTFNIRPQEITDAHTGVHLAFGVLPGDAATQWTRVTCNGKISTLYFYPDGQIKNIVAHPSPGAIDDGTAPSDPEPATSSHPLGETWHDTQADNHPDREAAKAALDANRNAGVASDPYADKAPPPRVFPVEAAPKGVDPNEHVPDEGPSDPNASVGSAPPGM